MTRVVTLAYGAGCGVAFAVPGAAFVALALAAAGAFGMWITVGWPSVVAWRERSLPRSTRPPSWWNAQAFSYALASLFLIPAVIWPGTVVSVVLLGMCLALSLQSALTSFCAGRLAYVVLFRRQKRTA